MAIAVRSVEEVCRQAREASRALARASSSLKDAALEAIAAALEARLPEILAANELDMQAGREAEIGEALLDRLALDEGRGRAVPAAVRQLGSRAGPPGEGAALRPPPPRPGS